MTSIAVVVPTYRRPDALGTCLAALRDQVRPADELVVVTRSGDPGIDVARAAGADQVLALDEPGVLAAMVAGARATSSEVIAFTDDDAIVPTDWLVRLLAHFSSSDLVGGVGGRDAVIHSDGTLEPARDVVVGAVTWYGRHQGHHHEGMGAPRDVSFLKGVNAAYRRAALGLPVGLRGEGAQPHFEVAVGRYARSQGWRLVYDPSVVVEHRPADRHGEDQRTGPSALAVADASYNLVVSIGGARGLLRVGYATLVGDRGAPGVLRAVRAAIQHDRETWRRLGPSARGTLLGGAALLSRRGVTYDAFA
jgi:glycosyltransferase involved in cell wall biosynthesis